MRIRLQVVAITERVFDENHAVLIISGSKY